MAKWILPVVIGLLVGAALLAVVTQPPSNQEVQSSTSLQPTLLPSTVTALLPESEARRLGIELAHQYGLTGNPWGISVRLMTRRESMALNEAQLSDEAAKFGLDPNQLVWLIVVRGSVDLAGKVPGLGRETKFDNMFCSRQDLI
jgi:hypothetical protein